MPGIVGQSVFMSRDIPRHGWAWPKWRNKFKYPCLPRTNGSPRMLHSSIKIGMHCFFAYYSISTKGSMISKTSNSGRCSMMARSSWWRSFGCGCGWAASSHLKCWLPPAATTSLDCSVQPNGTPRMDFICSLWELQ